MTAPDTGLPLVSTTLIKATGGGGSRAINAMATTANVTKKPGRIIAVSRFFMCGLSRQPGPSVNSPVGRKNQLVIIWPARKHLAPIIVKWLVAVSLAVGLVSLAVSRAEEVVFEDDFKGGLGPDWSWVREHRQAWRVTDRGLEVRVEPGNMWGPPNNARNLLVRSAPDPGREEIEISVNVEN